MANFYRFISRNKKKLWKKIELKCSLSKVFKYRYLLQLTLSVRFVSWDIQQHNT